MIISTKNQKTLLKNYFNNDLNVLKISSDFIDSIYDKAIRSGSLGGKILGAGGGGFFLFYVNEENIEKFIKNFSKFQIIKFKFENKGSSLIFNNETKKIK